MVKDILSDESRHPAAKVFRMVADPEEREQGKDGRRREGQPPVLRSRRPERRSGCSSAEPYPPSGPTGMVARQGASGNLRCGLARPTAALSGFFELAIAFGEDHRPEVIQAIGRCDVSQRAVQPDVVVVLDVGRDAPAGLVERRRAGRAQAPLLEALVPAFELAVGLGITGTGADMGDADQPNELLEIAGDELGGRCRR